MSWYTNIWKPKSIVTVFVDITPEGKAFSAGKLSVKPDQEIDLQMFDDLESVVKKFGTSKAYHLHVLGSGILSRKIVSTPSYKEELILNGNPDEFLFSSYDDGEQQVVSFTRLNGIQQELELIAENKWHFLGFSCGNATLCSLLEDEKITLDYDIELQNGKVITFSRALSSKQKCQYRGEFYTEKELLAKSIVQASPMNEAYTTHSDFHFPEVQENYRQFAQFKTFGMLAIGTIFVALLSVYFYQNHLNQAIAELELDVSIHNENLSLLDRLEQEKERKGQLITNAGVNSKRFLTFYLDEIGNSVPAEITLSDLSLFPVQGKLKNKQRVELDQERISIVGSTKGNEVLDDWMEKMNRFDWVVRVELLNYLRGADEMAEFELIMIID